MRSRFASYPASGLRDASGMFENIIGQRDAVNVLSRELGEGSFPQASLFWGPAFSGKLSTALETARVLTCADGGADWACECRSCRLQKELLHPNTVLLGSRYSEIEIAASADALRRAPKPSTRFLFLRAVRKLSRRFDPEIWEAEESRTRQAQEKVSTIEELLHPIVPPAELPAEDALAKTLERIIQAAAELAAVMKNDHIGIAQVRRLSAWAHLTSAESLKVAVIENADRMQESARNAMLKLLEEPPGGVRLILTTSRRSAVIPTVLSRLRPYTFFDRPAEEEKEVLAKIFRDETGRYADLRSFFLAWKDIKAEELGSLCRRFMERVNDGESPPSEILKDMQELFPGPAQRDREAVLSFLEDLLSHMRRALRGAAVELDTLERWTRAVREAQTRIDLANMNPQTVVESLFLRMRG
jgi:DNA polymerase-3 subunit delta'